jgi:fibrillarin-like pre-rRNA processing protein
VADLRPKRIFPGVYKLETESGEALATLNLTPGKRFYGEQLVNVDGVEYRTWNPFRSKLAAGIVKGLGEMPLSRGDKVLYLGVASGTTCSHVSDIIGVGGHVWGVDFAPRPIRDLVEGLAKHRDNVSPILGDARRPRTYALNVPRVDGIYADVAQPDQAGIVVENTRVLLKSGGWAVMAVKSRSIDVTKAPQRIYEAEIEKLREGGFEIVESLELDPFEKDHALVVARLIS